MQSKTGQGEHGGGPLVRSAGLKAALLALLALVVCFVPYHVPVQKTVGLSYIAGFNNFSAAVLFSVGSLLFAWLCGGVLGRPVAQGDDQPLSRRLLWPSIAFVLVYTVARLRPWGALSVGTESAYAINRLQMLMAGGTPYSGFEFVYGPLQLYVPWLLAKLPGMNALRGFFTFWVVQWMVGTAMLWYTVARLPFPIRWRNLLYVVLFAMLMPNVLAEGVAYTPVRMIGAAFALLWLHGRWQKSQNTLVLAGWGLLAVAVGMGVSTEQGTGIAAGLLGWLVLLAFERVRHAWLAAAGLVGGVAVLLLGAMHVGVFTASAAFAKGALNYPVLPSPTTLLLLFAYVAAASAAVRAWRTEGARAMAVPLLLGGFAMLPAALGRCDYGHLQIAAPAFLLGVASVLAQPALRRWWAGATLLLVVLPYVTGPFVGLWMAHRAGKNPVVQAAQKARQPYDFPQPCTTMYYAPSLWPRPGRTPAGECMRAGFYPGTGEILTDAALARKIAEMESAPEEPLLFYDLPLSDQIKVDPETDLSVLHGAELSPWVPRARNTPFSFEPLLSYVLDHYEPAEVLGTYRVWRPKPDSKDHHR